MLPFVGEGDLSVCLCNADNPSSFFPRGWILYMVRSRLYRSQILQVNMRWRALAEIYKMHSFASFCTVLVGSVWVNLVGS